MTMKNVPPRVEDARALQSMSDTEILDVGTVMRRAARFWWAIALALAVGIGFGLKNMHDFSPAYVARMTVAPVTGDVGGQSGGGASAGVLAILPQLGLGGGTQAATKLDRAIFAATTIEFATMMDQKYGLMQQIFGNAWDEEKQQWRRPGGMRFEWRQRVNSYLNLPVWLPPSIEDLAGILGGAIKVDEIPGTDYKRLSYAHPDPERALWFLSTVYNEATEYVRTADRHDLEEERRYLERRLNETQIIELRAALVGVLAGQARREMTMQKGLPYVARVVEPVYVSKHVTTPNAVVEIGTPVFVSFAVSALLVLVIVLIRSE
jgi:hypothetical protein